MDELNEKYLISEIIKTPNFIEGKILKETIQDTGKSMLENVNHYKNIQEEYKEYIELWIHEVKIPIAASKMIIENNKNNEKVAIELKDIEQEVYTDSKWATFIINQIIQNAIKYSKKENKKIEIYSKTKYEFLILISSKKYIAQLIFWNL